MNAIYKFVMSMLAKRGGKTGLTTIQRGRDLNVELSVKQIARTLEKMGVDISEIKNPKEVEKFLNIQQSWLKQQTKGPTLGGHRVIDATSSEGQGITRDLFNMSDRLSGKNVIKTDFGGGITDIVTETITKMKTMEPIDAMKEANSVIARKGKYKNLTIEQSQEIIKKTDDHIFQREMPIDEDFAQGGRTGYKEGFKVYPQISGSKSNVPLGDGYNVDLQDLLYGGTIAYEKGPFSGGIEYLKGKNKYDLRDIEDTLQKDTSDSELLSLILKMDLDSGLKARLKGNKDNVMFNISKSFAQGGRTGTGLNYLLGEDDQNSRVPYSKGSRKKESWTDKLTRWGGGPSMVAGELGFEGLHQIYQLLGMGGLYAEGGRTGFGLGGMTRRAFLKLMGAGAAGVGVAKSGLFGLLKGGGKKAVIKDLTSVPIKNIEGMPAWFKPLVNKVIKEGDDVTKTHSTLDRQIVHNKKLGDPKDVYADDITVTQDLNTGNVRVEYHSGANLGEAPIQLDYKAAEEIPLKGKRGSVKTKEEFSAVESEPRVANWDGDIEFDGENVVNVVDDLISDTTKLETYATGKNPNIKKLLKSDKKQKYVNKLNEDQMEQINYIENKTGHLGPEDLMDEGDAAYHKSKEGLASGGRVPFIFGGGAIKNVFKRIKDLRKMPRTEKIMKPNPKVKHLFTEADKLALTELKLEHAQAMLDMLKSDRQLFLQFQSNKAMKDEGLDFLMKKMLEPMAPHIKGYKSLKEIDEAILNMEMIVKNKAVKQGRHLNATGGRVSLSAGGVAGMLGE